jgi:hypothetical protein
VEEHKQVKLFNTYRHEELYSFILPTQQEPLEIGEPDKDKLNFTSPQLSGKINQFVMQFYMQELNFRL